MMATCKESVRRPEAFTNLKKKSFFGGIIIHFTFHLIQEGKYCCGDYSSPNVPGEGTSSNSGKEANPLVLYVNILKTSTYI